jgi:hypothetical protein
MVAPKVQLKSPGRSPVDNRGRTATPHRAMLARWALTDCWPSPGFATGLFKVAPLAQQPPAPVTLLWQMSKTPEPLLGFNSLFPVAGR